MVRPHQAPKPIIRFVTGHSLIIQGGMGVAVSDWRLAGAVSSEGQLSVVSGTDIDTVLVRRLQLPLTLGTFDWTIAGHVAFLVVMGMIGVTITARRLDKLLLK